MLAIAIILLLFIGVLFLIWFFYLNIYEVKFYYDFDPENVQLNKPNSIECKGINLLGKEIGFRNLESRYQIESGSEIIEKLHVSSQNNFKFVFHQKGTVKLLLSSRYSLNPSRLILQCRGSGK